MDSKATEVQNFFDLNSLNSIRQQSNATDKASKQEALQSAAKQFEAIFMQMLLKSMRQAQDVLESDSPFNSQSTKFYRDMHDQQLAVELSSNGSLGLSDLIVRQLGGDSENFTPRSVIRADADFASIQAAKKAAYDAAMAGVNKPVSTQSITETDSMPIPFAKPELTSIANAPDFEQPQDFVHALTEPAKQAQQKLGVPFEVIIAQAALETGWGQKIIHNDQGQSSNNLFNIKADARWSGDKAVKETLEYEQGVMVKKKEPFRVYDSLMDSVNDYVNFLSSGSRYQQALEQVGNVEQFLLGLQSAGYATDPNYADKILGTLSTVGKLLNK